MPRVSVIMPTYNRSALCARAVESVLDQTYQDFELIVADDGSTDGTREAIEGLSDKIVYLPLKHGGRSRARNEAISVARGEYVAFLDSDDVFLPHTLARQVEALDGNRDYGMVYGEAICFSEDAEGFHSYKTDGSGWLYRKIAFLLPLTIVLCSVMVRRSILSQVGGFDEKMERFEDADMWRRISKKTQLLAIAEPLCKIYSHEGNVMQHPKREYGCIRYYTAKIFKEDTDVDRAFKRDGAARLYIHYCKAVREKYPDSWAGLRFALRAVYYQPHEEEYRDLLFPDRFWQHPVVRFYLAQLNRLRIVRNSVVQASRIASGVLRLLVTDPCEFLRRVRRRLNDATRDRNSAKGAK